MYFRLDIVQNKRFGPPKNLTELFLWAIVLFREIVGYQNLGLCVRSLVIKDAVHILHILQKYIYKQIQ